MHFSFVKNKPIFQVEKVNASKKVVLSGGTLLPKDAFNLTGRKYNVSIQQSSVTLF